MSKRRSHGTGSIRERAPGVFQIEIDLGRDHLTQKRRKRYVTVRGRRRDAERLLREALTQRDAGLLVDSSHITLGEWTDRWLAQYRADGHISDHTLKRYRGAVRTHVHPVMGHVRLQDVRRAHVTALKSALLSGEAPTVDRPLAPASVRKTLLVLRQALESARESGLIAQNPASAVKLPSLGSGQEMRALTEQGIRDLLEEAAETRLDAPIKFSLATGIRQSEMLALMWDDFEPERAVIHVRRSLSRVGRATYNEPKSRSRRTLELSRATIELLRRHRVQQAEHRLRLGELWQDHGLIFPSEVGTPWIQRNLYRDFRALLAKSTIEDPATIVWHTLRHTAASQWLLAGVSPFEVARRLGHSSTNVTERVYAHLLPGGQQKSAHALDHLLG